MAIKKKLIHFNSFDSFISKKLSANKENTKYIDPSTFEQVDGSPDILFQSICYIKDIKQIWTHGEYFGNGVGCVSVTESKLRTMISKQALIPGQEYCITDYLFVPNTTWKSYIKNLGTTFYIIVKAKSKNELYEEAHADVSPISNYYSGHDLSKWKIWYDITGQKCTYVYSITSPRGGIYRMIDEYGNECPYDFKNLMFIDVNINGNMTDVPTFCYVDEENAIFDLSMIGNLGSFDIDDFSNNIIMYQPNISYFNSLGVSARNCIIVQANARGTNTIINNRIDNFCVKVHLGRCENNIVYDRCQYVELSGSNNIIKSGCQRIIFSRVDVSGNVLDNDVLVDNCTFEDNLYPATDGFKVGGYRMNNAHIRQVYNMIIPSDIDYSYCSDSVHYTGTIEADGGIFDTSDERLKTFGDKINIDFNEISKLKKHYFTWNRLENSTPQIGVSAQEIQKLYPEIVHENGDGTLSVAYNKLSVVALAAIDKLHEENLQLKSAIKVLNDRLDKIEK